MARDIWTGKEPYLKGHRKDNKIKFWIIGLLALLVILIFASRILHPTGKVILEPAEDAALQQEDLSQYDGMSNRDLLDQLYKESGLATEQPKAPEIPVKDIEVLAKKYIFEPSVIEVNKGDKVRITLVSLEGNHSIRIPTFFVSRRVPEGKSEVIEFNANRAGQFTFSSIDYSQMKGTIIVK